MRIVHGLRGHVEIPEGASILGSIEIPNGVDVRISFEEIEGGYRLYVANAGQVQSIDLLHGEKGDTGNGIASAVLNDDYTLTITFTDGTTYTTPSLRGAKGDPGISPTVNIAEITGGHRITITDAEGTHSADVMDGQPGYPGDPGVSPTVTIAEITGGHRITITDAAGRHSADVMNGRPGDPGVSPTVTIAEITGGHRVTITDATGAHSMDVMNGTGSVQGVQVNGMSVVTDGVADIPIAATNVYGVVRNSSNRGIGINQSGELYTISALNNAIKAGSNSHTTIVPYNQHVSTFYGLAKAAGDTTQSASSNPVGTYTESAKAAIKSMLGITDASGEVWHEVELSIADYDPDLGMIIFDSGNGNKIAKAELFGQIVNDGTQTANGVIYVGFGNNNGNPVYGCPGSFNVVSTARRVGFATKMQMHELYPQFSDAYTIVRCATAEYFRAGTSGNSQHVINVDTPMNLGDTRATNFYWNFNDPRYIKIVPTNMTLEWAWVNLRYTLM